jgi:hypothetical protein
LSRRRVHWQKQKGRSPVRDEDHRHAAGANMVRRLLRGGHQCVAFDRSPSYQEGHSRGALM